MIAAEAAEDVWGGTDRLQRRERVGWQLASRSRLHTGEEKEELDERAVSGIALPIQRPLSSPITLALSKNVYNQGVLATCVSFSVIEQLQYAHALIPLSQPYLIVTTAKALRNCANVGKQLFPVMAIARDVGTTRLSFFDNGNYNKGVLKLDDQSKNICVPIPPNSEYEFKFAFENVQSLFLKDRDSCIEGSACFSNEAAKIKGALEGGLPVSVLVPVISGCGWRGGWREGEITSPSQKPLGV